MVPTKQDQAGNARMLLREPALWDPKFLSGTKRVYKTRAEQCNECIGTGQVRKVKKDGTPFARPSGCKACNSLGSFKGLPLTATKSAIFPTSIEPSLSSMSKNLAVSIVDD